MWIATGLVLVCGALHAAEPRLEWSYEAKSNLYAPPVVADIHPAPGLETVLSDSEARTLVCIDAAGQRLWEFDGGWTRRMPSPASVSWTARTGSATLIVANSDGKVCCIDGATGTRLWDRQVGTVTWGTAIWADLDGDGQDEAVIGTENAGIHALESDGTPVWACTELEGRPLGVQSPIAAADIDGDGTAEIFALDLWGPVCLAGDGTVRWRSTTGDEFLGAPVVADADNDGVPELYCASRNSNALHRFNAVTGFHEWAVAMVGEADTYPSSSTAVGDLDQDGQLEIVAADALGHVYCLTPSGAERWRFATEKPAHAAPSLGDVDGDGDIEVLVASGDHSLYCLNSRGDLEWRYPTKLRLMYPATIADVDSDGKTEILVCGGDHILRCLTLDGRYVAALVPWPSRRFDVAQSGSSSGKRPPARRAVAADESLFAHGGFEFPKRSGKPGDFPAAVYERISKLPLGWVVERGKPDRVSLDAETKHDGASALRISPGEEPLSTSSNIIELPRGLRTVTATVSILCEPPVYGPDFAGALLRWTATTGVVGETPLTYPPAADQGATGADPWWQQIRVADVVPPAGARWLTLVLTAPADMTVWWDDAAVTRTVQRPVELRALVNQAGYDVGAPKRFTVRSTFLPEQAVAELVDASGNAVFSIPLDGPERITGAYGNDWGYHYWQGKFSDFDTPGTYRVRLTFDGLSDLSWPFAIDHDLLWTETARPAYRFFYYQRCGMAVPGFHGPCHLDDAVGKSSGQQYELWGGWHDAGDYNTYHNAPYVFGLAQAYTARRARFDQQDEDGNGLSDFLDEILWGGDHSRRMIAPDGSAYGGITTGYGFWGPPELETDNVPGTGDERTFDHDPDTGRDSGYHTASMARIARFIDDNAGYIEAAKRGLEWAVQNGKQGPLQLSAALDLFAVTGDDAYAALAKRMFPGAGMEHVEIVRQYDATFGEDHEEAIRDALVAKAEAMLALADNPFGVYTYGPSEKPNFFGAPAEPAGWNVGTSTYVLNAAATVALAYEYEPDPRYLAFVYDQFNWILGTNPFDLCLMEGAGSFHPPSYHHRYTFSGVPRGAVPGSVVNGITWRGPRDDRPRFDMTGLDIPDYQTNEVWLPHNTAYLNALANLQTAREN